MNTEAIDNLIARMQRAEQERDALRETVLSIGAQRDELLSKLDAAMMERDAALALANINVESELLATRAERDALRAKLDASERAAAEMRRCLEHFQDEREAAQLGVPNEVLDALASDAGRDYVHRSEVDEAWRKGMTDAANISGAGGCLCPEDIRSARDAKTSTT